MKKQESKNTKVPKCQLICTKFGIWFVKDLCLYNFNKKYFRL